MITLYLITGPAGVGKSTISEKLANKLERSAHIEGDTIYNFVKGGYISPWKEGNQLNLLWQNLVTLSYNYFLNEYNVVLDYIITMENIEAFVRFSEEFKDFQIKFVVLTADEEILIKRDKMRPEDCQMGDRVLELLKEFKDQDFDENHILDTSNLTIDEVVEDILKNDKYIVDEKTFFNEKYFKKFSQENIKDYNNTEDIKNIENIDLKTLNIMKKAHIVKYKSKIYMITKINEKEYEAVSKKITSQNKHVLKFHDEETKTVKEIIGSFEDVSDDKELLEEIYDENIWLQKIGYLLSDKSLKLFMVKGDMSDDLEHFAKEDKGPKREKTALERFYELTEIPDPSQEAFEITLRKADQLILEMTDVEFIELMKTPLNPDFKARFMEVRNKGHKK